MGSRGRSIRLRIYFLVAIPLVTMVGLLAYLAGTLVSNAIDLDRVPNLINASGIPAAKFGAVIQAERAAAVVYLFAPDAANLAAYQAAIGATDNAEPAFTSTMTSRAVLGSESPGGAGQIETILGGLKQLPALRSAVRARAISPLDALGAYSRGMADTIDLFLIQTKSVNPPTSQQPPAFGLIATVQARERLSQEDALLSGMLAGRQMTAADRVAFDGMAADRQSQLQYADRLFDPPSLAAWNAAQAGSAGLQGKLAGIEQAIAAGAPVSRLPLTPAQWQGIVRPLLTDYFNGGVAVSQEIITADHRIAHAAWVRVAVVGGIGLLGLLVTVAVTILVGRGIIRRLRGLESTALTLAERQLPDVVTRLRRGEDVDPAAEAPPLRVGQDEIGRVGRAFDLVRQTAIRAAVDEARLRRGLNDVFRSLARRSQSLLHRQLTLLDQMERRATDPEALDDLFRLDHLTTRMRRHAEGLVILSGAPPGRAWSSPVRMVDVMRGAIAEVEDYARVSVATRSQAALSGSAVADVIHLLAELIENATTLSPPYTSVRVSGEVVANGFAIEVEDRGLGMSQERIAELNQRLASPPEFNPSDSEQLGLFVVSQLARRHGIKVTLRPSPYGGTSAVVLIPRHLVVTEEALRAGLPGEPAALAADAGGLAGDAQGWPRDGHGAVVPAGEYANGTRRAAEEGPPRSAGGRDGHGPAESPGIRISGAMRRAGSAAGGGAHAAPARDAAGGGTGAPPWPAGPGAGGGTGAPPWPAGPGAGGFDAFRPHRPEQEPEPAGAGPWGPVGPDLPATGSGGWPGGPSQGTAPATPATPATPAAGPRPGPPWELSPQAEPAPSAPDAAITAPQPGEADAGGDVKGLPRRIKQASLAPQLKADPPYPSRRRRGGAADGPTPAEIRRTMSALQRGWEDGREPQPGAGPAPEGGGLGTGAGAGGGPGAGGGGEAGAAADARARGDSDAP
jgi:signal transduction histidine kinase